MRTMLRSKITLLFMMLGLLVAVPTVAFAAQTFTLSVPVNLDVPGYPTGINIHGGNRVVITADGLVDLDCNNTGSFDDIPPDGQANNPAPAGAGYPLPGANVGALLGRIGTSGDWFLVGSGTSFTAQKSGQLYLIVNDTGNFTDNSCRNFTVKISPDTTPPRVISTVPTKGATGLGPNANAKATFSEDMLASTINGQTFKLFKKGSTNKVGATVSYDASRDRAILNPNNSLQRGATYKAVVTTAARDEAGNRLDQRPGVSGLQQKQWFFTISD
jgi:hypothetical protein